MKSNMDLLRHIIRTVSISVIVPMLSYYISCLYTETQKENKSFTMSTVIACIIALVIDAAIEYNLYRIPCFRKFHKYEGKWIEIIPDFPERPVAVCDYVFLTDKYQYKYKGTNYNLENYRAVTFEAEKFIINHNKNGFYYITNETKEKANGFGEITFTGNNIDGLTRAEGYFFDVSNRSQVIKHEVVMIKYDEAYFKKLGVSNYEDPEKFTNKEIIERSKEIIEEEIAIAKGGRPNG